MSAGRDSCSFANSDPCTPNSDADTTYIYSCSAYGYSSASDGDAHPPNAYCHGNTFFSVDSG